MDELRRRDLLFLDSKTTSFSESDMTDKQVLRNFVKGGYVEPADGSYSDLIDPCTGDVFAAAPVSGAAAVDAAMRLGTNYPSGPLEWGERIGLDHVLHTLDALNAAVPDGRYRVVLLLRQLAERRGSSFGDA